MGDVKSYRDLIVWQKAIRLAKNTYEFTRCFPREEIYGLRSQVRRAAVSVAANIAEGHARETTGEFRQFLGIARGSLAEMDTLIILAKEFGYSNNESADSLLQASDEVGRLLSGLQRSLAAKR